MGKNSPQLSYDYDYYFDYSSRSRAPPFPRHLPSWSSHPQRTSPQAHLESLCAFVLSPSFSHPESRRLERSQRKKSFPTPVPLNRRKKNPHARPSHIPEASCRPCEALVPRESGTSWSIRLSISGKESSLSAYPWGVRKTVRLSVWSKENADSLCLSNEEITLFIHAE